jgi:acetyltransferase-like isoleucine patch superfamily enzyme
MMKISKIDLIKIIDMIGKFLFQSDFFRIISKVRFSLVRGILRYPFLQKGSKLCMIGKNCVFIRISKLKLGKLSYIGDNSFIDCDCKKIIDIGDRVTIREGAWIQSRSGLNKPSEGLCIGNNSYLGPYCVIGLGGYVEIGSNTQIGARFTISAESHLFDLESRSYTTNKVGRIGIKIGNNCWFGNNVNVLDGVTIGNNCVIGANTLVTKSIPPYSKAYGVPAKYFPLND